jgi:hypothetical protein
MKSALKGFVQQLKKQGGTMANAPAKGAPSAGKKPSAGGDDKPKTDDSGLAGVGTVYVSPDGGKTDEAFPKPEVEYDFCAKIVNAGKLPSSPFFVLFELTGTEDWQDRFDQEAGLKPGGKVTAVVHFGKFANPKKLTADYYLTAHIHLADDPDTPIGGTGDFGIVVNRK